MHTETYVSQTPSTNGVYIVPAFTGLGAPYWDQDCRGIVTGITRGTKKEHFVRAALESIDYQVYDLVKAMQKDANVAITSLNVDGGASANNFLMQFQADILNATVVRPQITETTALGACYLAGIACGYWNGVDDIKQNIKPHTEFVPTMDEQTRATLVEGWEHAIRQARCN